MLKSCMKLNDCSCKRIPFLNIVFVNQEPLQQKLLYVLLLLNSESNFTVEISSIVYINKISNPKLINRLLN